MLVLSRKLGEKIWIGQNICITVVDIDRGKIRLGIEAPRDVPIYRQELLPLNDVQNQQTDTTSPPTQPQQKQ
jgi:carbon storage regulator